MKKKLTPIAIDKALELGIPDIIAHPDLFLKNRTSSSIQQFIYSNISIQLFNVFKWDNILGGKDGKKQFSTKARIRETKVDNGRITKFNTKNFTFVNDTLPNK